jgi:hypothetical protein
MTEPWVEVMGSPHLPSWLASNRVSLAFTTYQTGKLFVLGLHPEGRLAVFERTFDRARGLWADGQTLWLGTRYQLWRFENLLKPGELYQGHDRLYVPKLGHTTGDLDAHDHAVVGLSQPRHDRTFGGLALDEELGKRDAEARCGLLVIDLRSGDVAHWLRVEGMVRELCDVAVLAGVLRPMALGFESDEIQRVIAVGEDAPLA